MDPAYPAVDPFDGLPDTDLAYFRRQVTDFAASGREPAIPRLAATVVLRRVDGAVFLMRRTLGMVFGGRWAFPGGSVDPDDRLPEADELTIAARAAVREVREEVSLELDPGTLIPWARWITPVFEPRRFDTYFFVAPLADGATVGEISGEASATAWLTPAEALERWAGGDLPMLPPTALTLRELADYSTVEEIVREGAHRPGTPILPTFPPN